MLDKILDTIARTFLFMCFGFALGWVVVLCVLLGLFAPKFTIAFVLLCTFVVTYFWALMRCSERGLIKFKPSNNMGPR